MDDNTMETTTPASRAASTWFFAEKPNAGVPVRNGFRGYTAEQAAVLAAAVGLDFVPVAVGDPRLAA